MKNYVLLLVFCIWQPLFSQSEVETSFALPIRNSLKFNRYLVNPTFSFVREQGSVLTFYNKRQWTSVDNPPQTYLVSYSGRFRENEGVALGLFQQNQGVLTTFGAVANFAHNIVLQTDSNLTFGLNLGFYKSGLNRSKIVTNFPDPILETIPSTSFFVLNPGINYGTTFLDFGVTLTNFLVYNLSTSQLITNDAEKSISAHLMHTGYLEVDGFFDKSKFSALLKSDFRKDKTILSGLAMLSIPNGVWAQLGYNTLYGISGGLGVNISQSIALEYNYERGLGNFTNFGASHEIGLAYKFTNRNYNYDEDEQGSIIPSAADRDVVYVKPKEVQKPANQEVKTEQKPIIPASTTLAEAKPIKDSIILSPPLVEIPIKMDSIAKVQPLAEVQIKKDSVEVKAPQPKDREFVAIDNLAAAVEVTKAKQQEVLSRLTVTIAKKEKDLIAMKEENDLSEKGIYTEPKPFKSSAAENAELESLKTEFAEITKFQKDKIRELENAYAEKVKKANTQDESLLKTYSETIQNLKEQYLTSVQTNTTLNQSLNKIQEATEIEKKRRIKRASFMNVDDRFAQDRATLKRIKETTVLSTLPLEPKDFDSGEEQPEVQIVKSIKNVPSGYYVVIAVHNEVAKRDDFLTKTVASGEKNINFFYDANSSKYFIYYDSFETIEAAKKALHSKGSLPYNGKMSIVKIENE
jgi:type IX secretion system PorP/SprF family membrane protein